MTWLAKIWATLLGVGWFPFAPGTLGSVPALPLVWLHDRISPQILWAAWLITVFTGTWAAGRVESDWGHDPGRVVIDEFAGMWLALLLAGSLNIWQLVLAFLLFRWFDIWKPGLIDRSQRLPGGWGIMTDDLLAGLLTGLIMIAVRLLF